MFRRSNWLAGIFLLTALPALAGEIIVRVDSTDQEVTIDAPAGVANGNCTLGEAILAANARSAVDGCDAAGSPLDRVVIRLQNSRYVLDQGAVVLVGTPPNASISGLPLIQADMTIDGDGATITRDTNPGQPTLTLLEFFSEDLRLTLRNLSLEGGRRGGAQPFSMINGSADSFTMENVVLHNFTGGPVDVTVGSDATLIGVQALGDSTGRALGVDISERLDTSPTVDIFDSTFSGLAFSGLSINLRNGGAGSAIRVRNSRFINNFGGNGTGLNIEANPDGVSVEVEGCTFADNVAGGDGGALQIALRDQTVGATAIVSLQNNVFEGNRAIDFGGAAYILGEQTPLRLTIDGDRYSRSFAREGGAMYLEANLAEAALLSNLTFDSNVATNASGIWNELTPAVGDDTSLRITRSAFINNFSYNDAAAFGLNNTGLTILDNSTVNGQVPTDDVFARFNPGASLTLEAVTLDNNVGREIFDNFGPGGLTLRNVVSTANPDGTICGGDMADVVDDGGNHLLDDTCTGFVGTDPMLGSLELNGGTTLNQLPQAGSPLIDAGTAAQVEPNVDQRGLPRVINGAADIGAVETGAIQVFASSFESS
ncbi:MAG: choice-of-anchor Q domain-containing protein [Pseudomonadota bacterium]